MLPPRPAVLCRLFCLMAFCPAVEGSYGDAVLRGVAGDDTASRSRGLICPRLAIEFPQPSNQRAQGMPGARCTRGLVCNRHKKHAHEHTGSAEASDIPCARENNDAYGIVESRVECLSH